MPCSYIPCPRCPHDRPKMHCIQCEVEALRAENKALRDAMNSDDGAMGDGMRLVLENRQLKNVARFADRFQKLCHWEDGMLRVDTEEPNTPDTPLTDLRKSLNEWHRLTER